MKLNYINMTSTTIQDLLQIMALRKTSTFYIMSNIINEPFTFDASMLYY